MNFAFPAGLYLLATIPIVIALYLRRVRPREQTLPSLLLWEQVLQLKARHRWMGKIRAWLSLLLQLIILLLLIFAICRPQVESSPARVIVLDVRARMQATDALGQSAFAKARRFAEAQIESARENSPIALVAAGKTPQLIHPFSTDPKRLREALNTVQPEQGGGDWDAAIEFAQDMAAALTATPEVIALTDRPTNQTPPNTEIHTFGTPRENFGFTAAGIRETNGSDTIYLRATSHEKNERDVRLDIEQGNRLLDSRTVTLRPGESPEFSFEFPLASGSFTTRLTPSDSLAADQSVQLNADALPPLRVLLISLGNWFVEKALHADESIRFEMLQPDAWNPQLSEAFDVTIFDRKVPANFQDRGHFIFLDCVPATPTGKASAPAIVEFDTTHPLLRSVKPDLWRIGEQLMLPSDPTRQEIVTGTSGPLLVTSESETSRWVAVLFPLEKSDLPLRASFPVLLQNLIAWTSQSSRTVSFTTAPLDSEGSDLRTAATSTSAARLLTNWTEHSAWRWLALLTFGLLLIEWRTYHRRLTE